MNNKFVVPLSNVQQSSSVGNKAFNLLFLRNKGFKIPKTFVCSFQAYNEHILGKTETLEDLKREIQNLISENTSYSVRSSANVEDVSSYSFAGQFTTHLNVRDLDEIIDAIKDIWESTQGKRVKVYRGSVGRGKEDLKMAVIIQEMIQPKFSGVVFTRNPVNGLDEIIVESVQGLGTTLVQDGVTPERWVYKWKSWVECPEESQDVFPVIEKIVKQAKRIAKEYGAPLDLEWAYDGNEVYWLQLREITTLRNTNIYSNRISKEFLPGIIKPLVWSVNIPVVNNSWKRLFEEVIGSPIQRIDINNLSRLFYYRAYFNMGIIGDIFELLGMPRQALEILAGIERPEEGGSGFRPGAKTVQYIPRMILNILTKLMFSKNIELFLRQRKKEYIKLGSVNIAILSEIETLDYIDKLFELNTDSSYYVIISQLLNSLYNMILKMQLEKIGINIDEVPFEEGNERLRKIDPRYHLSLLHLIYEGLPQEKRTLIENKTYQDVVNTSGIEQFVTELGRFIQRFGHLSDSGNDFSGTTWGENPDLILKMISNYSEPDSRGLKKIDKAKLERMISKKVPLKFLYGRAAKYLEYRETVNFLYIYGYGLFRFFFLHLGNLFVEKGLINEVNDIFYLPVDKVRKLAQSGHHAQEYQKEIQRVKTEIEKYRSVRLPEIIYNDLPPSALMEGEVKKEFRGVATSKGHYVGSVKVVKGISDFDKIQEGDVLVIPYSDVSWTPLFAKAKAVVSESGGILSHCSIVAREYGIPAVVSVGGVTDLKDGITLAVDGYNGRVSVLEE